jgi:hypothetical protein
MGDVKCCERLVGRVNVFLRVGGLASFPHELGSMAFMLSIAMALNLYPLWLHWL